MFEFLPLVSFKVESIVSWNDIEIENTVLK